MRIYKREALQGADLISKRRGRVIYGKSIDFKLGADNYEEKNQTQSNIQP